MQPPQPSPIPVDLQSMLNIHGYLNSIPNPSETVTKCKIHLEEQISKIIHTIDIQILKAQQ